MTDTTLSALAPLKEAVWQANLELPQRGLVTYTWGNASGIDRQRGLVVIKPSGIAYENLHSEDMVVVNLAGEKLAGRYKPSSDLATHLVLYRAFPHCGGVVHTHARNATTWAQAGLEIPVLGTTHADYFYGPIPCTRPLRDTEIRGAYEEETGKLIVETFAHTHINAQSVPGVLVCGHGPFTWGSSAAEALHNAVVLEELAYMALQARTLNPSCAPISQILLDKHFLRKHGKHAYYGQS